LHDVPGAYGTQIKEVLLTALALAFGRWTGTRSLLVDLEGHGREPIGTEIDLSRTVGWFTTLFPVLLEWPATGGPGAVLTAVKDQLDRIPNRGIGYGLLRYLLGDEAIPVRLRALPQAEVRFNYLGQLDRVLPESFPLALARESMSPALRPRENHGYRFEIDGWVVDRRLQLAWTYDAGVHREATVEALARGFMDELRRLLTHGRPPEARGFTPADFPEAGLDQGQLDEFLSRITPVAGKRSS
jgi:non-ribosomal peptide synthase protein (TIGR01720 family)